jgi:hypothetical protein
MLLAMAGSAVSGTSRSPIVVFAPPWGGRGGERNPIAVGAFLVQAMTSIAISPCSAIRIERQAEPEPLDDLLDLARCAPKLRPGGLRDLSPELGEQKTTEDRQRVLQPAFHDDCPERGRHLFVDQTQDGEGEQDRRRPSGWTVTMIAHRTR